MLGPKDRTLEGKKGLVLGIANRDSIAYGCAKAFKSLGAELALTYLNDKAKPYVEPIAKELGAEIFMPCECAGRYSAAGLVCGHSEEVGALGFCPAFYRLCPQRRPPGPANL